MKAFLRKSISLILALTLTGAPLRALDSEALGEALREEETSVHHETTLNKGVFWSNSYSDLRTENYVVYTPGKEVKPIVTYGPSVSGRISVSTAAAELEAKGYRVVAGINGDYYSVDSGIPLGTVVTEGEIRNACGDYYAIGFRADGTSIFGKPALSIRAQWDEVDEEGFVQKREFPILAVNYTRNSSAWIYMYTHEFNAKHDTDTTQPGTDVICSIQEGTLSIGGELIVRVDEVRTDAMGTVVDEGKIVLSANNLAGEEYNAPLRALEPGDTLRISVSAEDEVWNEADYVIGALYPLVENGEVCTDIPSDTAAPRTAIGQRADGSLVLYTIDGRRSGYSAGATLRVTAKRMAELGCVSAMSLDGGGSTTLVTTAGDRTSAEIVNKPSDNVARNVTNHIFLVASAAPSGVMDHVYLSCDAPYAMPYAQVRVSAAAVDKNYIPMPSRAVEISCDRGSISDGVLTMPASAGGVSVRARSGGFEAKTTVEVLTDVDSITLRMADKAITALSLPPLGSVQLSAQALYRHLPVASTARSFTWSVSGEVGSITEEGVFTAADADASGSISVRSGKTEVTIPVSVRAGALHTLADFESDMPLRAVQNTQLGTATGAEAVRFGRASARIDYSAYADSAAVLEGDIPIPAGHNHISAWVYGNGSGDTLTFVSDAGALAPITLDFSGYKAFALALPAGAAKLTRVRLDAAQSHEGTLYLDQIMATYGTLVDETPPQIQILSCDGTVRADVRDGRDGTSLARLRVTYDGEELAHSYDKESGTLSAALREAGEGVHRVTVSAVDASGNIARASVDIPSAGGARLFTDTEQSWAADYIDFLARKGIISGYGEGVFMPDNSITRQEFAVLLQRYLAPEGDFSDVTLPFADAGRIDAWAIDAVRAMYALGVTKGSTDADGQTVFAPSSSITRAEAVTMIGRLQEKGYVSSALTFTDSDAIAAWAAPYVQTLSAQGVLGGYEDGSFCPMGSITRAQVAKILYTML